MKILYFADTRFPIERANGLQSMATCHALAGAGYDVTLVTRPDRTASPRDPFEFYGLPAEDGLGFETIRASGGPRRTRLQFLLAAARRARRHRGVVMTRDLGLASLLMSWPPALRPRLAYESHGISAIVSQEMPALLGPPAARPSRRKVRRLDRQDRRVWRRAAAYVTITAALADDLAGRYGPRDEVFVVPDGAVVGPAPPMPAESGAVAGYAGHLYPWKGVDVLVRALALAPNIQGLIVGGHPGERDLARVRQLVTQLGLQSRVEITGLLDPAAVARQLARATILVLPNTASTMSMRYSSPLKLFEYLAMGRAIVASDLPAVREIVTHEDSAILVPPDDPESLAAALIRVAGDSSLSQRLADAARQLAPTYSWDERGRRLSAAIEAAAR